MSAIYNDGTVIYGTATLTVDPAAAGDNFTLVVDGEFAVNYPSRRMEQPNALGEPSKAFAIAGTPNGSCTVIAGATLPVQGDTFTTDKTSAVVFYIDETTPQYISDNYAKVGIKFSKKIN